MADRWLEGLVLKRAHKIVVVNSNFVRPILKVHCQSLESKIVIIPNGFDPSDFAVVPKVLCETSISLVHAGRFYPGRSPISALSVIRGAFEILGDNAEATVYFVGSGEEYLSEIDDCGLGGNVECTGFLDHSETIQYLLAADFLLLIPGVGKSTLTGKIFEYFASGRPIILIGESDSAAAELVEKHKAGIVIDPKEESSSAMLAHFIARVRNDGWSGPIDISMYSRVQIASQFAALFSQVVDAAR